MSVVLQPRLRSAATLPGAAWLSQRLVNLRARRAAPIFSFERVLPDPRAYSDAAQVVTLDSFVRFLEWVHGSFDVVPLEALGARSAAAARVCALVFDGGWMDTFAHAFPVLRRMGITATVFLPVHLIGSNRRFWRERLYYHLRGLNQLPDGYERLRSVSDSLPWCPELSRADAQFDRLQAFLLRRARSDAEAFVDRLGEVAPLSLELVGRSFMSWEEVRTLQRAGFGFGGRAFNDCNLDCAPPAATLTELNCARLALSEQLETEVRLFSYPWGVPGPRARQLIQAAGYAAALTARIGWFERDGDPFVLPRISCREALFGWPPLRPHPSAPSRPPQPARLLAHLAWSPSRHHAPSGLLDPAWPVRLGFIVPRIPAWVERSQPQLGEGNAELQSVVEALDPQYFQVEFYCLETPAGGLPLRPRWPCFAAAPAGSSRFAGLLALRRLLLERRPTLVQCAISQAHWALPVSRLAGVPVIVSASADAMESRLCRSRLLFSMLCPLAAGWQPNARWLADCLSQAGIPRATVEILPDWVDLKRIPNADGRLRLAARARLGLSPSDFVAVHLGNSDTHVQPDACLAAAGEVAAVLPAAQFILLADAHPPGRLPAVNGPHARRIRVQAPDGRVADYLAAADVAMFVAPHAPPAALLACMAAGLPTLVADTPANRGLVSDSLLPLGDSAAWAMALLELARDPELRRRLGAANRRRAEQHGAATFPETLQNHYLQFISPADRRMPARPPAPALATEPDLADPYSPLRS